MSTTTTYTWRIECQGADGKWRGMMGFKSELQALDSLHLVEDTPYSIRIVKITEHADVVAVPYRRPR